MSTVDTHDFDAFMAKVDLVHSAVKGLKDGTTSVQQSQQLLTTLQPPSSLTPATPIEEHKEQLAAAVRVGAGVGDRYEWWCGQCRLEYEDGAVRRCERCGASLTSRAQRHAFLKQKVQRLSADKQARRERRERFKALKLARQTNNQPSPSLSAHSSSPATTIATAPPSSLLLPTSAWDEYEPSSSSDSDSSAAAHNPAFAALEADLSARQKRRQLDTDAAEAHKAAGNRSFATQQYQAAADCYTAAIERRRGEKVYYANRAACWLKLQRWDECVKDCSAVLDVWELIERGEEKRKQRGGGSSGLADGEEVVVKALMRRSEAWKAMKEWDKARVDLERAASMESVENKRQVDIRRLLNELREQQSEQQKEAAVAVVEGAERQAVMGVLASMRAGEQFKTSAVSAARRLLEADDKWRVLLRSERGVEVSVQWLSERQQVAGKEDQLVVSVMDMLWAAAQNERNKDEVVAWKGVELLAATVLDAKSATARRQSAWRLLASLGESAQGRRYMLSKQPLLFSSALTALPVTSSAALQHPIVSLLANLAFDNQWKTHMLGQSDAVLAAVLPLWHTRSLPLVASLASLLSNLSTQPAWRPLITAHPHQLATIATAVHTTFDNRTEPEEELLAARQNVLGVVLNLSIDGGAVLSRLLSYIRPSLPLLLAVLRGGPAAVLHCRLLAVLAKAASAAELRDQLVELQAVETALAVLERGVNSGDHTKPRLQPVEDSAEETGNDTSVEAMEHAARLVAACTSHPATTPLLTTRLPLFNTLLASTSPYLAGNTALVVSILALQPSLHALLSVCVVGLLRVMRECSGREGGGRVDAANNAAIACARLARQGDNMTVIRANGGMALVAAAGKKSLH